MRPLPLIALVLLAGCSAPPSPVQPSSAASGARSALESPPPSRESDINVQAVHGDGNVVVDEIDQESHGDDASNVVILPRSNIQTVDGNGNVVAGSGHRIHQVAHGAHASNVVVVK
jgi:hypothetical protein